jgi:hypothetical protein
MRMPHCQPGQPIRKIGLHGQRVACRLIAGSNGWLPILADVIWHRLLSPNIARCPPMPINAGWTLLTPTDADAYWWAFIHADEL